MATTSIYRTPSAGDLNKWTMSFWVKRASTGGHHHLASAVTGGGDNTVMKIDINDILYFEEYQSSAVGYLKTNRLFRDLGAWYHIVFVWDTDNVTSGDRMILYVNGVRETSFSTETYPGSGQDSLWNSAMQNTIGEKGSAGYFDGSMSHIHFCDGYAYAASDFGETDATSGIWKIKTSPSVSYGTNGFFLKMEDRTNLDLDSSPNAHTFTTGGTLTPTKDNPSNNFCTMNPLVGARSGFTWSNGNNKVVTGSVDNSGATMAFGSGKWYYEILCDTRGNAYPGWQDLTDADADENDTYTPPGFLGINPGVTYNAGSGVVFSSFKGLPASDWTDGDYIGLAFDMDNLSAWWSLNGQWYTGDNATPTTLTRAQVSADTNGFDCSTASLFSSASLIAPCMGSSTASTTNSFNFGNGVFASTVLGGTTYNDDAGNGIFKYEPPDGFRAICTKNIKAYGG